MTFKLAVVVGLVLALGTAGTAAGTSVLFVGNSFLFGFGSAVRFYRASTVTDLNDEGIGGVPALFKSFTQQAGLDYDVSLETRGGVGLDFHLANKLGVIDGRAWDKVVMPMSFRAFRILGPMPPISEMSSAFGAAAAFAAAALGAAAFTSALAPGA
jgi:hypothetical protein